MVVDGRLVWILDAYTVTDRYPYAQRVAGVSYMRNSVKVTVDAYDGTTTFYGMTDDDPVLKAWASALPGWLQPADAIPASIGAHLRYPLDLFWVQAHLFGTYHMVDPQQFYNREDEWQIASIEADMPYSPGRLGMELSIDNEVVPGTTAPVSDTVGVQVDWLTIVN